MSIYTKKIRLNKTQRNITSTTIAALPSGAPRNIAIDLKHAAKTPKLLSKDDQSMIKFLTRAVIADAELSKFQKNSSKLKSCIAKIHNFIVEAKASDASAEKVLLEIENIIELDRPFENNPCAL